MIKLHNLTKSNKKKRARRGRGMSSGYGGHTVGYGNKGQKARGKGKIHPLFDGNNTPMYRKLPIFGGFKSRQEKAYVIHTSDINATFKSGEEVTIPELVKRKLLADAQTPVKVLFDEKLKVKVKFNGVKTSKKVADSASSKK